MNEISIGVLTGMLWAANVILLVKEAKAQLSKNERIALGITQLALAVMLLICITKATGVSA